MFAREGAVVVLGDVAEEEGHRVEPEIKEVGGNALFVLLDVTSEESWRRAIAETISRYGRLDVPEGCPNGSWAVGRDSLSFG